MWPSRPRLGIRIRDGHSLAMLERIALALGQKELAAQDEQLLQLFKSRQPYREG